MTPRSRIHRLDHAADTLERAGLDGSVHRELAQALRDIEALRQHGACEVCGWVPDPSSSQWAALRREYRETTGRWPEQEDAP